jgi:ABC-type nitrate/sulfonate/bicarbonate transport system substrate-binding protein
LTVRERIVGLLVALAAMLPVPLALAQPALDPVRVQLKWRHQFQFAGHYAAIERGFYREAGLDVLLLEATDSEEPARVVLDGRAQFGIATSDLAVLRAQGKPVVALAAIFQHSPYVLVAAKRPGLEHVHDLVGRRVMVEHHSAELLADRKSVV